MMRGKGGQIGTTVIWIAATFLIIFILLLYFFGVLFVMDKVFSSRAISVGENQEEFLQTKLFLNFIEENEQAISDWADDEKIVTLIDRHTQNVDKEAEEKYILVYEGAKDYFEKLDIDKPVICFERGDKNLIIDKGSAFDVYEWRPLPPHERCSNNVKGIISNNFVMLSEQDKLVEVYYYDETNFGM